MLIPLAIMSGELHLVGSTGMVVSVLAALGYITLPVLCFIRKMIRKARSG